MLIVALLTIFTIFNLCISESKIIDLNKTERISNSEGCYDLSKYVGKNVKIKGWIYCYGGFRQFQADVLLKKKSDRNALGIGIFFTNETIAPPSINLEEPTKSTYVGEAIVSGMQSTTISI